MSGNNMVSPIVGVCKEAVESILPMDPDDGIPANIRYMSKERLSQAEFHLQESCILLEISPAEGFHHIHIGIATLFIPTLLQSG